MAGALFILELADDSCDRAASALTPPRRLPPVLRKKAAQTIPREDQTSKRQNENRKDL